MSDRSSSLVSVILRSSVALGLSLSAMALGLAACEKQITAPDETNTCFQIGYPANGQMKFNSVKKNVKSIEYCAAELDQLRMLFSRQGVPHETIDGAYNGSFIFIEGRYVKVSTQGYDGPRFTLLVRTDDGRLVAPGAIVQETVDQSAPVSEPKNLPH